MAECRFFASVVVLLVGGCAAIGPPEQGPRESAVGSWISGLGRQYRRVYREIGADLSAFDSDDDGLETFGPVAAREMRSLRAESLPASRP